MMVDCTPCSLTIAHRTCCPIESGRNLRPLPLLHPSTLSIHPSIHPSTQYTPDANKTLQPWLNPAVTVMMISLSSSVASFLFRHCPPETLFHLRLFGLSRSFQTCSRNRFRCRSVHLCPTFHSSLCPSSSSSPTQLPHHAARA
ncbi:unnamed protein product [Periconia digitata]|uniref:Uncharacterized protein n=1 Tax=Periconia digitata TaxID=1303443 RepID=A0A9W4UDV0_9PLEO|nr:unnamed protein product [Periconia digitata]